MSVRLFVGGLSFTTSTDGLRDAFARFGPVQSAAVMTDRETGRSRGFGFVEMASEEEAERAISGLNGSQLDGRMIRVDRATPRGAGGPPRPRPAGGGFAPRPGGGGGFSPRPGGGGFGPRPGGGPGGQRFGAGGGGGGGGWTPPLPEGRGGAGRRGARRPGGPGSGPDFGKGPRKGGPKRGAPGEDRGGRGRRGSDGDYRWGR
jgi:RNA recognition motif. (a.k.a. RRM, RBD, or RNP domain)